MISRSVKNSTSLTFSSREIDELNSIRSIDRLILSKLTQKYANKCIRDGYVLPSLKLLKKSDIYFPNESLQMSFKIDVEFEAEIVNPDVDSTLKIKIESKNAIGFLGTLDTTDDVSPLIVLCPKDLASSEIYKTTNEGDVIEVVVVGKKFEQNDTKITCIAKIE